MTVKTMQDLDLKNKRVLIREDLNVPLKDGEITSDTRIVAALSTIQSALQAGAGVMVMSHLGRPQEGSYDEAFSLAPVAKHLSALLGQEVALIRDWLDGVEVKPGQVVLLENVRFNKGEKENNLALAEKMAALCDVYVMDAFATSHRQEASTCGITEFAKEACMGPLMQRELEAIYKALKNPTAPVVAIVGGSKVSTKLKVLDALSKKVDTLIVGGGIANTFIAAAGYNIGHSLWEEDFIDEAERLMQEIEQNGKQMPLPVDVVTAEKFSADAEVYQQAVDMVSDDEMILDIGPKTAKQFADILLKAGTILWNGPVGAFEIEQFAEGTKTIAHAVAKSEAFSLAGGGDTLAAVEKYGLADKISYISTGGGAFLFCLQGQTLPAVAALEQRQD